jgi:uncharacterized protein YjiS (DUF1127 family)
MHTEITTTRTTRQAARRTPLWLRLLNRLADRDAAYRASHKLRAMPDERLDDMGMTREDANTAFYARGSRRADETAPATLVAFRAS